MKGFYLGLALACALTALLWSALWGAARAAAPLALPAAQARTDAPGLIITATVGTNATACAGSNIVQVRANTPVYYCYTLRNTGDITLTLHRVQTARQGVITTSFPLTLYPGTITNTVSAGLRIADSSAVDVSNVVTWSARTSKPITPTQFITVNAATTIDVVSPNLRLVKTVAVTRDCETGTSTLPVPSGTSVYYCITLENIGDMTFFTHTVTDQQQSVSGTFRRELQPGQSFKVSESNRSALGLSGSLGPVTINQATNNTAGASARTLNNLVEERNATASVSVGTTTVIFTKTVSTSPTGCNGVTNIVTPPGSRVYYCASVFNNGVVTLTHHHFVETYLSIDVELDYVLAPGARLDVTNETLARANEPIVFGPFELSPLYGSVINNTMYYTGTSAEGFRATTYSTSSSSYPPTPTNTPTRVPEATSTWTPIPTWTPTWTPIPLPPTFTPIPTPTPVTPTPTPTRSYAISLLETPTPRGQPAAYQAAPGQSGFDPAAATATAAWGGVYIDPNTGLPFNTPTPTYFFDPVAATATTMAGGIYFDPFTGIPYNTPTPPYNFDPVAATATAAVGGIYIDPNTGLPYNTPTPAYVFDPVAATATTMAGGIYFDPYTGQPIPTPTPFFFDSAAATATAAVGGIYADPFTGQPYPTPTFFFDAAAATATTMAGGLYFDPFTGQPYPTPTPPVFDPAAATATTMAGGIYVDPTTGMPYNTPTPPYSFDPAAATATAAVGGIYIDPNTGLPYDTPTPAIDPNTGLPIGQATDTPVPPTEIPTDTPAPPTATPEPVTATPTQQVIVVTNTPLPAAAVGGPGRPIEYPTPTVTPDTLLFAARTFDTMVATAGWIWFLVGSLVFFITAGIVAGLFFRQAESHRFELEDEGEGDWAEAEQPASPGRRARTAAPDWPENLP